MMKTIQWTILLLLLATIVSCKVQKGLAKGSQIAPKGITMARGYNPYWQVDVSAYEMLFKTAGEGASNYPTPIPTVEGNSLIYTTQSKKNREDTFLSLTIVTKACYDDILKKELPYTVTGKRNDQVLIGCAQ